MPVSRGRGRPSRSDVRERLTHAMLDMETRFGGLPTRLEAEHIWREIWREEAHNSTALEGNTLVQQEVDELLEHGVVTGRSKQLAEYLEVRGYAEAADWVYQIGIDPSRDWKTGDLLTLQDVRMIHSTTVAWAWRVSPPADATPNEGPGSFREHEIQPFASGMQPPTWTTVPSLVQDWLDDVNALRGSGRYPIDEIAAAHSFFERIHPFLDGNGRTGRLVSNLILVRLGMPPAIIYQRDRRTYLHALARSDGGEHGALTELVCRAVLNNLNRLMLPALAGPVRLVPLAALANLEISHGALRSAAARGALKAQQDQLGQWQSSQVFVDEYLTNRGRSLGRPRTRVSAH